MPLLSIWLSVRPTVCPSVTFRYAHHTGWNTSKIISRLFSLRVVLGLTPTSAIWCLVQRIESATQNVIDTHMFQPNFAGVSVSVIIIHRQRSLMVIINRTCIGSCENSHVSYCSLIDSHGVGLQSGAIDNARCNQGQSRSTSQCTPTLLSKQHVELFQFHTDRATRI